MQPDTRKRKRIIAKPAETLVMAVKVNAEAKAVADSIDEFLQTYLIEEHVTTSLLLRGRNLLKTACDHLELAVEQMGKRV